MAGQKKTIRSRPDQSPQRNEQDEEETKDSTPGNHQSSSSRVLQVHLVRQQQQQHHDTGYNNKTGGYGSIRHECEDYQSQQQRDEQYSGSYQPSRSAWRKREQQEDDLKHDNDSFCRCLVMFGRSRGTIVALVVLLLLALVATYHHTVVASSGSSAANPHQGTVSSSWNHQTSSVYDYIVVGGGPSGILVATKLAERFPSLKVLLLESGTASQTSVLQRLRNREDSSKRPKSNNKDSDRDDSQNDDTGYGSSWFTSSMPSHSFLNRPEDSVFQQAIGVVLGDNDQNQAGADFALNKFDVPLLWSGVASSQGRRKIMHLQQNSWSGHHWPIQRTLMARGLGGSGLHNAMIYVRSLPSDFAKWTNLTGWTDFENDILPHYKALERLVTSFNGPPPPFWDINATTAEPQSWRGYQGPVTTVRAGSGVDPIAPLFVQSALNDGHSLAALGFNEPDASSRIGAGYYEFNIQNGVRDSIAHSLLGKESSTIPNNLEIRTGITVTRALMERQEDKSIVKAIGVEFVDTHGHVGRVFLAERGGEVILSAGAIMTPQLLVNSGIGGKDPPLVDLPGVGQNLQDHPVVALAFNIAPDIALETSSIYTVADEMEDYFLAVLELEKMTGSLSNLTEATRFDLFDRIGTFGTSGFSAGAFLRSPWARDDAPDIQLTVFPRQIEPHVTRQQTRDQVLYLRSRAMLVTVALLQPDARYEVRTVPYSEVVSSSEGASAAEEPLHKKKSFRSADSEERTFKAEVDESNPFARLLHLRLPAIELPEGRAKYLSERDVKILAWGIEQVRSIQKSPPLSEHTADEIYPGASVKGEDLFRYVREQNLPNSHWVGSTKMGLDNDPMAVVDEKLRVRGGVQGLRIVDAGVIPYVPNGNTHSTTTVVASRAADLIADSRQQDD